MKTHKPTHVVSDAEYHDYQIITILFAISTSLVLGLIPIIYGLSLTNNSQQPVTTEISPWSPLGER